MKNQLLCNLFILSLFLGFPLSFSVASAESLNNQKHQQSYHNINGIQLVLYGSAWIKKGRKVGRDETNKTQIRKPMMNKKRIMDNKTTIKPRPVISKVPNKEWMTERALKIEKARK